MTSYIQLALEKSIAGEWNGYTRFVWKVTETTTDEDQRIACLEGGGNVSETVEGHYLKCQVRTP